MSLLGDGHHRPVKGPMCPRRKPTCLPRSTLRSSSSSHAVVRKRQGPVGLSPLTSGLVAGCTTAGVCLRTGSPPKSGEVVITLSELKSDVPHVFNPSGDGLYQFKIGVTVEVQEVDNHRGLDLYRVEFAEKLFFFRAHEPTLVLGDEGAEGPVTVT